MTDKIIKLLSLAVTVSGIGLNIASNILSERQLDNKIKAAVSEALKHR